MHTMTGTIKDIAQNKSDHELLKMVYEIDEWSPEMLTAVEMELSKRNILPNDIGQRKQQLIEVEETNLAGGWKAFFIWTDCRMANSVRASRSCNWLSLCIYKNEKQLYIKAVLQV